VNTNTGASDTLLSQRLILNTIQNENKRLIASKESEHSLMTLLNRSDSCIRLSHSQILFNTKYFVSWATVIKQWQSIKNIGIL